MSAPLRTTALVGAIARHASPILIAQLASMSTAVVDTAIAGHVGTLDLAAVGIGGGVYISVALAFAGIVQGVTPVAAQHYGAKRLHALPGCFQQSIWLALLLGALGVVALAFPGWLLHLTEMSPAVEARTRSYLSVLAWAVPGMLIYRACGGMLNALGKPRMLMFFGFGTALLHLALAPSLAFGWLGLPPLGVLGCALSMLIDSLLVAVLSLWYLARSPASRTYHLLQQWQGPQWRGLGELLRVGIPIGMSTFIEITSFALIALAVSPLGPIQVAGHRIAGNFAGVCYMLPLSISIATLSLVGQAAGAADVRRVRKTVRAGLILGIAASVAVGVLLWSFDGPLVRAYTPDAAVQAAALGLIGLIASYQLFDAVQTVGAQALRGLKISTQPMFIHMFCFWGIGLAGGWWLCFRGVAALQVPALGLPGFWWSATLATVAASVLFGALLRHALRRLDTLLRPAVGD
ncbi:MAG: MATE family efflux transporter [Rhodocyclaceae bacterium]